MAYRILYISPLPPPSGGIATWMSVIKNRGLGSDFQLRIVDSKIDEDHRKVFQKPALSIYELRRNLLIIWRGFQILLQWRPHIVHINSSVSPLGLIRDFACAFISKLYGSKIVSHYHGDPTLLDHAPFKFTGKLSFKLLSTISDQNIVLHTPALDKLRSSGCKTSSILHNFIDDSVFHSINSRLRFSTESPLKALYVGAVTKQKGSEDLLRIASQLPNVEFIIVGEMMPDMCSLLDSFPINCRLLGACDQVEVMKQMIDSDFFIFPSHTEGFPMVILEAICAGLPIISTRVGCIAEILSPEGSILCEISDQNAFVEAINLLTSDSQKRKQMGNCNRRLARKYTFSNILPQIKRIYSSSLLTR